MKTQRTERNAGMYLLLCCSCVILLSCSRSAQESNERISNPLISKLKSMDEPLGVPEPGDWLNVRQEAGQTFEQYVASRAVKPDSVRKVIYIQPIGVMDAPQDSVIQSTSQYLSVFFGIRTVVLGTIDDKDLPVTRRPDGRSVQLLTTDVLN
jgi:hypothetical protein